MKLAVVIPNWNGKEFLKLCLDSLIKQSVKAEIVVVDNGSIDGSAEFIKEHYPKVKLIELEKNYGFAGGVNRGIEYALKEGASYIALFNNDAVADKDWLKSLVARVKKDTHIGIVAAKQLHFDKQTIDSAGEEYSIWGTPFWRGNEEADKGQYDTAEQIFAASGGASLYRAEMFKEIGLFDERFFAYYEDVDLSFRARLAGWQIWYEPTAKAYHHVSGTSAKHKNFAHYHIYKNQFYLYLKNMPGGLFWRYLLRFKIAFAGRTINHLRAGRFGLVFKAWLTIAINLPSVLNDRYKIQKRRRISLDALDTLLYHAPAPSQQRQSFFKFLIKK